MFVLYNIRFLLLVFSSFPYLCDWLIQSLVTGKTARKKLPLEALRSPSPAPVARTFRKNRRFNSLGPGFKIPVVKCQRSKQVAETSFAFSMVT